MARLLRLALRGAANQWVVGRESAVAQPARAHRAEQPKERSQGLLHFLKSLGPGLISGASDNDPTTVATVSVIGSTTERPPIEEFGMAQTDAGIGMLFAVAVFWFILIGTGATLGIHHHQVQTDQDAAQALVPVAGPIAGYPFAIGLLASAILAVPVLAATSAYVLGSEFGWVTGLSRKPQRAYRFYAALAATLALGVVVSFAGVSPINLLFIASIIGGLGTPISMAFLLLVAQHREVMGDKVIGPLLRVAGWATMTIVSVVSLFFLWQQFGSSP